MEKGSRKHGTVTLGESWWGRNSQVYVYNLNYKFDRVTEA